MADDDYEDIEIVQASSTDRYKTYLIESWIELTQMSEMVMVNMLQGRADFDTMNAYISRLVHLLINLYPKIEGGSNKTADLLKDFDSFKPWIYRPTLPVENRDEGNRVPELLFLIRKAYERLNLTQL
jgi:hypothetical protein